MALKLRRRAFTFTNAILPQTAGAGSFKRVLDSALITTPLASSAPHENEESRGTKEN